MIGNKMRKKYCILILCIAMTLTCACGGGGETNAATTEAAVTDTSAPAIDVSITVGLREYSEIGDFTANPFTEHLRSAGYSPKQELFSKDAGDNEAQIKNMVTVGQKLPDLLFDVLADPEMIVMTGQAGAICDLQGFLYEDGAHQQTSEKAKPFWDYLHEEFSNKEIAGLLDECSDQKTGAIYALPLVMPEETGLRYLILTNDCENKEAAFDLLMKVYDPEGVKLLSHWLAPFSSPADPGNTANVSMDDLENYVYDQYYSSGIFSAKYGSLLYVCSPDHRFEIRSFREADTSGDPAETQVIASLRKAADWKEEYLDTLFFVYVMGRVMTNPDVPYMLSQDQEILSCILRVDGSSVSLVSDFYVCGDFATFAIIYMARY